MEELALTVFNLMISQAHIAKVQLRILMPAVTLEADTLLHHQHRCPVYHQT